MFQIVFYSLDSVSFYQLPRPVAIDPFWCKWRKSLSLNWWFPIVCPERHSGSFRARSWFRPNPWRRGRRLGGPLGLSQTEDGNKGKKGNSHHLLFSCFSVGCMYQYSWTTLNWFCLGSRTQFIWVLCKAPIWPQNAKSLSWLWSQLLAKDLCSVLQHCTAVTRMLSSWTNQYLEIPSR